MSLLLRRLWADDSGTVLTTELVMMTSILSLGTMSALVALRQAAVGEATEVANAIMAMDQSYTIPGHSGAGASTAGSAFTDTAGQVQVKSVGPQAAVPAQQPCD
jgi:hypothetical protein